MRRHRQNEEDEGNQHHCAGDEVGGGEGEMLRQHAAREDADTQAEVPGGEIGGSGRAALGVGAEIDEECVERRERRSKAQATT